MIYEGFEIHEDRLSEVMLAVSKSLKSKYGIFKNGLKPFLPQWNLPEEMEYSPQRREVAKPKEAGELLYGRTSIDRLSLSWVTHRQALSTWINPEKQWIFKPREIIKKSIKEVQKILTDDLYYAVPINPTLTAAEGYYQNAQTLVEKYDGDPRNLIYGKTVEQARKELTELQGVGTGIANLIILEFASRNIVLPTDFENIRPKIDRHKSRIPLNTDSISLRNGFLKSGEIHASSLVDALENAYVSIAKKEGLSLLEVDNAIWIIGSEICTQRNYTACLSSCPLIRICKANTGLNHERGYFKVFDKDKRRVDEREKGSQINLPLLP